MLACTRLLRSLACCWHAVAARLAHQQRSVCHCLMLGSPRPAFPPSSARVLLRAAYRNPRVTKFALMSESDLPLYSPHLLYSQVGRWGWQLSGLLNSKED